VPGVPDGDGVRGTRRLTGEEPTPDPTPLRRGDTSRWLDGEEAGGDAAEVKDYYALSEQGRARRLRAVVEAALEHYDLAVVRLRLISNDTNGVFRIDTSGGEKYVVRVGIGGDIGHSAETVAAETEWLVALDAETDVVVPVPLPASNGSRFVTVPVEGVPDPRNVVLFSWLPGRLLHDRMTPETVGAYGALAARLHVHGATHRPAAGDALARYDRVIPFDEPVRVFDYEPRLMAPDRRAVFEAARDRVERALIDLASVAPMQILHGDLHVWNVMASRRGLAPFDFEDIMWGWPIQDIATALYYLWIEPGFDARLEAFRLGYESVAPWPERTPGELEAFLVGRILVLANGVVVAPEYRREADRLFARFEHRLRRLLSPR
jgi:Ser/Thr protein kinase RdoA (MazF antagonist)